MGRATAITFWPRPPGALRRDQKVKYDSITITKSLIPNFVFVLTYKSYKHIAQDFFILMPRLCPRGTRGALGVPRKYFFPEHGHVSYQTDGDDE